MTRSDANRIAKRLLISGISLVVAFCAAQTADASCGDYLHTRFSNVSGAVTSQSAGATEMVTGSEAVSTHNDAPSGAVPPCSGPNCRRSNESLPPLVPSLTPVPASHEALAPAGAASAAAPAVLRRFAECGAAPLAGYPVRPEEPPQSARLATGS